MFRTSAITVAPSALLMVFAGLVTPAASHSSLQASCTKPIRRNWSGVSFSFVQVSGPVFSRHR